MYKKQTFRKNEIALTMAISNNCNKFKVPDISKHFIKTIHVINSTALHVLLDIIHVSYME